MTTWTKAIQHIETATDETDAREMLDCMKMQYGFIAGRILADNPIKPGWRVQMFFEDCTADGEWLPDGSRRVIVPPSVLKSCEVAA